MLGKGRTNGSWWRCRLNWRRELPRTQRLSCLSKRRGSFLAWRQVGARRDEHAGVCSLCCPCYENLSTGPAVANGSRLRAKRTRTCSEFGHHSIQMQPTPPEFCAIATECFPNSPELHANATHICHDFGQYSTQMQPNTARIPTQMQPVSLQNSSELHTNANQICLNSVNIPSTCKPNRPNFMPTSVVERHTKNGRVWR